MNRATYGTQLGLRRRKAPRFTVSCNEWARCATFPRSYPCEAMLYFPRPLPDELLGSVVGRACRETGLTHKELVFAICGLRRTYSSIFLPSYLRRLAGLIQCDVEELIYAHSVFPYIVSFMSEVSAAKVRDLVLARQGISDGSFVSASFSAHGAKPARSGTWCPSMEVDTYARESK